MWMVSLLIYLLNLGIDLLAVLEQAHISSFFEFEFGDEFADFWIEYFEHFKFCPVRVSQKYKTSNSNFFKFEI